MAADRAALLDIMAALGVPVRAYKVCAGWIGEKAGRLKFNGRLDELLTRADRQLGLLEDLRVRAAQAALGQETAADA